MTTGPNDTIAGLRGRINALEDDIEALEIDNAHVRGLLETYIELVKGAQTTNGLLINMLEMERTRND